MIVSGLVTPATGWAILTSHEHELSKRADGLCALNVTIQAVSGGIANIGTVPSEFRPAKNTFIGVVKPSTTTTLVGSVMLEPSGRLSVPYYTGSAGSGEYYPIAGTWQLPVV